MSSGFITLHRKIIDWEWYADINTTRVFIHLLLKANHKDKKHRGTLVKRGELLTSFELLSKETGLSIRKLRTSLKNLELTNEVTREATNKGTRLTVCNYDTYQTKELPSDKQDDKPETNERQASDKQTTTNNNVNNLNNENKRESNTPATRDYLSELTHKTKQHALTMKMKDSDYQEFLHHWMVASEYDELPRWFKGEFFDGFARIKGWLRNIDAEKEETPFQKSIRELRAKEHADNDI